MDRILYQRARENKDSCFDGEFFFGVKTTGIFCRPSCPSPTAKEENVEYFSNVFQAIQEGYRPCQRCIPEHLWNRKGFNIESNKIVSKAFELIRNDYLIEHSVSDLASAVGLSVRHMRKLFQKEVGCPPIKIAKYQKSVKAAELLSVSDLKITQIALACGFGSIRGFNSVFKEVFDQTPSQYRKSKGTSSYGKNTMFIPYGNDFDFEGMLEFMKPRLIEGVESIDNGEYSRTFCIDNKLGYFVVRNNIIKRKLELDIFTDHMEVYLEVYYRVKTMFDIDAKIKNIENIFNEDGFIGGAKVHRVPIAFDPYEFLIRAILGQQITVKAATTLAARVAAKANKRIECSCEKLYLVFPQIDDIEDINLEGLGITKTRVKTIRSVNKGIKEKVFDLKRNQSYREFYEGFIRIKGIGDWTVNYVAMRGLGMPDAFPAKDLGVIKAMRNVNPEITHKEILEAAENWRPYRSYATLCLWRKGE